MKEKTLEELEVTYIGKSSDVFICSEDQNMSKCPSGVDGASETEVFYPGALQGEDVWYQALAPSQAKRCY